MTQAQLAHRSGVHQTTISALERQQTLRPSWETAKRLADALYVKPEAIWPIQTDQAAR